MSTEDIRVVALLLEGWMFGILTCLLYVSISGYRAVKHRNRRHQDLLDAGVDPLTILTAADR